MTNTLKAETASVGACELKLNQFDKSGQIGFLRGMQFRIFTLSWLVFLSLASSAWAYTDQDLRNLAQSEGWLNRLLFEKNMWGKWRSLVDGKGFFFAENGKYDAYAELVATLEAADKNIKIGKLKQVPRCAFPERYRFLSEKLNIKYPPLRCDKLEDFLKQFNSPQSISLVYSSAYPNNPASMFGHTLLKVNSKAASDLLDQGLNYAALVPDDENPFAFFWFGVAGGYLGQWSNLPFYVKVNEYIDQESRDLWEYELNISPDETRRVIEHLWEIETNSHMFYYFFDENCAYMILKVMVSIKPEWKSILDYNIYVIPGETVKRVMDEPGAVKAVHFRPSKHKKLWQRYSALTSAERDLFFSLRDGEFDLSELRSRPVADTLAHYYDYIRSEKNETYRQEYETKREKLLAHRATLGLSTEEEKARLPIIRSETRPDIGHDPYMVGLGRGLYDFKNSQLETQYTFLRLKSAYHDLLNKDAGFSPYAHIEFPHIDLAYDEEEKKVRVEQLTGLATTSFFPLSLLEQRFSWKVAVGLETRRTENCENCKPLYSEGGVGYAFNLGSSKNILYGLGTFRLELYRAYKKGSRYGPGVEFGFLANPLPDYKLHMMLGADFYIDRSSLQERLIGFHQAYSFAKNWELRNTNDWYEGDRGGQNFNRFESRLLVGHFFR